jgi:DNA-binding transcriptional ArsR family regulator
MVENSGSLDRTYAALAHPSRRTIMELLRTQPGTITDLAAPFDVSFEAVSKHIRVLEAAGLVSRIIQGRDHVVSLQPEPLLPAGAWIDTYRRFWEERLKALKAHLEANR